MYIEHLKPEMHFPIEIMLIHRVYFPKAAYICLFNLKCVWTTIHLKEKQNIVVKKLTSLKQNRETIKNIIVYLDN